MTSAVTTETAFVFIRFVPSRLKLSSTSLIFQFRHACDELLEVVQGVPGHMKLVGRLFERLGLLSGPQDTREVEFSEELGDLICMPASSLLDDYSELLEKSRLPVFKPGHFGSRIANSTH